MRAFWNYTLNFTWTGISFLPLLWYWLSIGANNWFYIFLALSLLPGFLPEKGILKLQLSKRRRFYEKAGVKYIQRFVQDGDWVKKRTGEQKALRLINNRSGAVRYLKTVSMYERFHLVCFSFFLLSGIHGLFYAKYLLSFFILLANVIYNVLPILLQQYNKQRIKALIQKEIETF